MSRILVGLVFARSEGKDFTNESLFRRDRFGRSRVGDCFSGLGERSRCSAKETKTARRTTGGVAVLDVNRLFKESKQFNAEMEKMKADVKKAEEKVKSDREKLKSQREEIEKVPVGSEERMKQEEYQNKLEAALEATTSFQKKPFSFARLASISTSIHDWRPKWQPMPRHRGLTR